VDGLPHPEVKRTAALPQSGARDKLQSAAKEQRKGKEDDREWEFFPVLGINTEELDPE